MIGIGKKQQKTENHGKGISYGFWQLATKQNDPDAADK